MKTSHVGIFNMPLRIEATPSRSDKGPVLTVKVQLITEGAHVQLIPTANLVDQLPGVTEIEALILDKMLASKITELAEAMAIELINMTPLEDVTGIKPTQGEGQA